MRRHVEIDLPYIQAYNDHRGKRRYYFRRKGCPHTRLPGAPGSPEFMAAYEEAKSKTVRAASSQTLVTGSFKALCHEYENSAEFNQLAPLTRREMGYVIRALEKRHGANAVNLLHRKHILKWRDESRDKPGAANKMLRTLKVMMRFAQDRGFRDDNPTQGVKLLKAGEWRAWTESELIAFESRWPLGSLERLGFALALYTGQRRADLTRLTFSCIAGNAFSVRQGKTGTQLLVPIHPNLQTVLSAVHPRRQAAILTTKAGKAFNPIYFGHLMAAAIEAAGLPKECVLHGLRKSAAVALIDAGCTPHQAAAITGHQTARMLEHYAKQRDQKKLGKAAMLKWRRANK